MKQPLFAMLIFMLLLAAGSPVIVFAQNYCDSSLLQPAGSALGYRPRGDRCEGTYAKPVGGTTLLVASFASVAATINTKNGRPILISWSQPPVKSKLHIRAQGIKRRLYYRMDTMHPADSLRYRWPSAILSSLNISSRDIGITGTIRCKVGGADKEVYLLLRISQDNERTTSGKTVLLLLPGTELKEVYVSLAPVGADGRPGQFIKEAEKLGYGYYPAERGIEIILPVLPAKGFYYLEIGATLINGGGSGFDMLFYNGN
ncbi:hypothetical protein [Terrimonas alba]|uniref:hypothetical protein n=1 Tax=Terrimonas alba TaxID=3349636 RepID=UPI0035F3E383